MKLTSIYKTVAHGGCFKRKIYNIKYSFDIIWIIDIELMV